VTHSRAISGVSGTIPATAVVSGELRVVATPIGNLADLSPRAREALATADVIAAEDTRHSAQLLRYLGLERPLVSLHEHNEAARVPALIARLQAGENVALVSDAGTPLLSDPGAGLVGAAVAAGLRVTPLPGASALLAALCVAGLPAERFSFEGFLPAKTMARRQALEALASDARTLVFYEAPHRIVDTLTDALAAVGVDRQAVVARELTKLHETVYRGSLGELVAMAPKEPNLARGEIVLLVQGHRPVAGGEVLPAEALRWLRILLPHLAPSRAAAVVAEGLGLRRQAVYSLALSLSSAEDSGDVSTDTVD
jgi:16S rRNA (cytidine1402-2'-O)-methyltransferase